MGQDHIADYQPLRTKEIHTQQRIIRKERPTPAAKTAVLTLADDLVLHFYPKSDKVLPQQRRVFSLRPISTSNRS